MKRLLTIAILAAASAQPGLADVYFQPVNSTVAQGGSVAVDVMISGITSPWLGAFDLTVSYDPVIVSATGLTFDSYLGGPANSFQGTNPAIGSINFAETSLLPVTDLGTLQAGGQFRLGTINFKGLTPGTSALTLSYPSLAVPLVDGDAKPIAMNLGTGSITVTATSVPEPSGWMAFMIPMSLSLLLLRRKLQK